MTNIKTLFVPVDDRPQVRSFNSIEEIVLSFGTKIIATYSTQIEGIGIVAGDQDQPGTINHLGIKGDFIVLGIAGEFGPDTTIRSLEDHEIFGIKFAIETEGESQ